MKCYNCGLEVSSEDKYCPNCKVTIEDNNSFNSAYIHYKKELAENKLQEVKQLSNLSFVFGLVSLFVNIVLGILVSLSIIPFSTLILSSFLGLFSILFGIMTIVKIEKIRLPKHKVLNDLKVKAIIGIVLGLFPIIFYRIIYFLIAIIEII